MASSTFCTREQRRVCRYRTILDLFSFHSTQCALIPFRESLFTVQLTSVSLLSMEASPANKSRKHIQLQRMMAYRLWSISPSSFFFAAVVEKSTEKLLPSGVVREKKIFFMSVLFTLEQRQKWSATSQGERERDMNDNT